MLRSLAIPDTSENGMAQMFSPMDALSLVTETPVQTGAIMTIAVVMVMDQDRSNVGVTKNQ